MKRNLLFILLVLASSLIYSQVPQNFNYQSVIRDLDGKVLSETALSLKFSILNASSTTIYSEQHDLTSSAQGLVNVSIGSGTNQSGDFSSINWSEGNFSLKVEMDMGQTGSFESVGESPLNTVPFAMFAQNVLNKDDADADATNEIQDLSLIGNLLSITGNTSATIIDLSSFLDNTNLTETEVDAFVANNGYLSSEVDASVTNEIQDLSLDGNILTITNKTGATPIDLSIFLDNTDSQNLTLTGNQLSISGGNSIALNVDDADADPLNETVQNANLDGTTLNIIDASGTKAVDLSSLAIPGPEGPEGPQGMQGVQGEQGVKGDMGATGPAGPQGDSGLKGDKGDAGATGPQGPTGAAGAQGIQGIQGEKGDAGTGLVNKGTWLTGTNYDPGDYVFARSTDDPAINSMWILEATIPYTSNTDPYLDPTNWVEFQAPEGPEGPIGPQGPAGDDATDDQDLVLTSDVLSIENGVTAVDLSIYVDDADADPNNEIQDLNLTGNILTITIKGSPTEIDLSKYLDNSDTTLNEAEVDAFVANNGYLTSEVDASVTNELQDLKLTGNILTITVKGSPTNIDLSPYLDNTNLTETEVDAFVADNGYLTSEVDGSVTNELQDLSIAGDLLTITGITSTNIDLSVYKSDTTLNETEVDAFVANNGYLTSENQDLNLDGNNLTITGKTSPATIDLSAYLDNSDSWTSIADTNIYFSGGRVGVGLTDPMAKMEVKGASDNIEDPLFVVTNSKDQIVFAVYEDGVEINIEDDVANKPASTKAGFAVGGLRGQKVDEVQQFLKITPDSTRIFFNDITKDGKPAKGGFAVGGLRGQKITDIDYLTVDASQTSILTSSGSGGFNVGDHGSKAGGGYLNLSPDNYFIGHESGIQMESGIYNTFIGYQSGAQAITGSSNIFIGRQSGFNNEGNSNLFIGDSSGRSNQDGSYNTFLGVSSGRENKIGKYNIFVGYETGFYNNGGPGAEGEQGSFNTYLGYWAGRNASEGGSNTYIGYQTGIDNIAGYHNTFVGRWAGASSSGHHNVFIGTEAGRFMSGDYKLVINAVKSPTQDPSPLLYGQFDTQQLILNGNAENIVGGVALNILGGILVAQSSAIKVDISKSLKLDIKSPLDRLVRIKTTTYKNEIEKIGTEQELGFSPTDLMEVLPEAVTKVKDYYLVDYNQVTVLLVEAVKEQQKEIEELKKQNEILMQVLHELKNK